MASRSNTAPVRKTSFADSTLSRIRAVLRRIRRLTVPELLEYAPLGWDTPLEAHEKGWHSASVLAEEQQKWDHFVELLNSKKPLGFSHEAASLDEVDNVRFHNLSYTFGYVLIRSAIGRKRLSILDWGGGLGYYYLLAKALLPEDINLDYHCKDVAPLVEAGRQLAPEIKWHMDDSCLDDAFDLVIVSGALQYCREWRDLLKQLRTSCKRYFFLTRTPVVKKAGSFIAVQRSYGTKMLHQQFNENELLSEIRALGFNLIREVVTGDVVYIRKAPEDAVLKGWLFALNGADR